MGYKYILFDLDGTLTDSAPGIINSVMYALERFGIKEDRSRLYKFVGPPLLDSFMKYYGFTESQAREAIAWYREYYTDKGMFENTVYDGIEEVLSRLKELGAVLMVATSKPEKFAIQILKHFHLYDYFDFVAGATMDEKRVKKTEVISYVLSIGNIRDLSKVLMVGDREHDIIGARQAGIDALGVLYGYGSRQELEAVNAGYIAETVEELGEFLYKSVCTNA